MKNRFAGINAAKKIQETKSHIASESITETPLKRGRPGGKRTNDKYQQVTAYIEKDTYKKVKIKLLENPTKLEFSEIVQNLLHDWISNAKC